MKVPDPQLQCRQAIRDNLATPIHVRGSGALRYAAAMSAYQNGDISAEVLEIYRQCSKFDHEDPISVARYQGVELGRLFEGYDRGYEP